MLNAEVESVAAHSQASGNHGRRGGATTALERLGESSTEVVAEECVEKWIDCAVGVAEHRHDLVQRYRPDWQRTVREGTDYL